MFVPAGVYRRCCYVLFRIAGDAQRSGMPWQEEGLAHIAPQKRQRKKKKNNIEIA